MEFHEETRQHLKNIIDGIFKEHELRDYDFIYENGCFSFKLFLKNPVSVDVLPVDVIQLDRTIVNHKSGYTVEITNLDTMQTITF